MQPILLAIRSQSDIQFIQKISHEIQTQYRITPLQLRESRPAVYVVEFLENEAQIKTYDCREFPT